MRQKSCNLCAWSHWDNNWMLIAWIWIPVGWWHWLRTLNWSSALASSVTRQVTEVSSWIPVKAIRATILNSESIITTSVEASAAWFMWESYWITWIDTTWATWINSSWSHWATWEVWLLWNLRNASIREVHWWNWGNIWSSWEGLWTFRWNWIADWWIIGVLSTSSSCSPCSGWLISITIIISIISSWWWLRTVVWLVDSRASGCCSSTTTTTAWWNWTSCKRNLLLSYLRIFKLFLLCCGFGLPEGPCGVCGAGGTLLFVVGGCLGPSMKNH